MNIHPLTIEANQLLLDGSLALAQAERNGIRVDVNYYEQQREYLTRRIIRAQQKFESTDLARIWKRTYRGTVNFDSDQQLAKILFEVMRITAEVTTAKGNPSVNQEALEAMDVPGIAEILEIRKFTKLLDTYIKGILSAAVDGYIHPFFHLNTVRTYRSSSSNPNFQNQPNRDPEAKKVIRRGIKARLGHMLLCADFKGIEVAIGHPYHLDPNMKIYLEDKSTDMHRDVAMKCFLLQKEEITKPLRQSGKGDFVFPQFYGDWYVSNAKAMWAHIQKPEYVTKSGIHILDHLRKHGITNYVQLEAHIQKVEAWFWKERFAVYDQWKRDNLNLYYLNGYVDYKTGFRVQGVMSRNEVNNYPVQGSAFHVLLWCFIQLTKIAKEQKWKSRLVGQIHDEIVLDVHPDELQTVVATLHEIMTIRVRAHWKWITVPLEAEIEGCPVDGSWYDKAPLSP